MSITGILTVDDPNNQPRASVQLTIPQGEEVVRYPQASELQLAVQRCGGAIFSHHGPPNSIIAAAYMIVQPVRL